MATGPKPRYEPGPTKRSMVVGALFGGVGAFLGNWLAPDLLAILPMQPVWARAAIIATSMGLFLLAALLLPLFWRKRPRD
jgi:hypothetical protein